MVINEIGDKSIATLRYVRVPQFIGKCPNTHNYFFFIFHIS